jgi:hypothetical protein
MIESSERMIGQQNNLITNKHFELQIKTLLPNAPRDAAKLQALLKAKEREKEKATHIEHKAWSRDSNAQGCIVLYLVASRS